MAVEKMKLMNIVAPIDDMHDILKDLILSEKLHIKNYTKDKIADSLTMSVLSKYEDPIRDLGRFTRYRPEKIDFKSLDEDIAQIEQLLDVKIPVKKNVDEHYEFDNVANRIREIYHSLKPLSKDRLFEDKEIRDKEEFLENIEFLKDMNFDISEIQNMEHFNYHIGTLTKERRIKLRDNYENIPAVVLHIGSSAGTESYLIFTPKQNEEETSKILKSLNFREIAIPENVTGLVSEVAQDIKKQVDALKEKKEDRLSIVKGIQTQYLEEIILLNSELQLEKEIYELKNNVAVTKNFFYFTGWISEFDWKEVEQELLRKYENIIVHPVESKEVEREIIPPTRLRNNSLIKPFELLVNMYGIPNYNELDPTFFLGITYLILFGAMFGDVGQGLVFILIGFLLSPKRKPSPYGEILKRIGVSSTIFGFLYGSIFGLEEVIPALLVRPMENINQVLYTAIGFGVVLLLISFGMSMYNLGVEGKKDEMIFGNHGLAGFIFYIALLVGLLQTVLGSSVVPSIVLVVVSVIALGMILLRVPLYAMVKKEKPHYEEGKSSYYIEGGFNLIETILSFLSNTISFIRVGAFALNHVGLFLAFTTMANMVNNKAIGIFIMVLGNIIIIGLEGLIVLIQGLRLEYYELFGKYFKGDGRAFVPVTFIEKEGEI